MQIVFGNEVADQLKDRYTILELETFDVEGQQVAAYCVVPAEKINLGEMPMLENNIKLHNEFLSALRSNDQKLCTDLSEHLFGKFGGELDSFYQEILNRFETKI